MTGTTAVERQNLVSQLADKWKPQDMRDLAGTLMRLADSLDQGWDGSNVKSVFRWPGALSRIERNAMNLALKAQVITASRTRRRAHLPDGVLGEPAWDMLLDLFMQFAGGAKVSTTSLCLASGVPSTTALRHIGLLEELGLVRRSNSAFDKRVTFVELTDAGVLAMGGYLEGV
jgi:DNA-binding transcriptional ArsR family regulator